MRLFSKNRKNQKRRSTNRKNFLRLEGLESRLALTAAPLAMNDFYTGLPDEPIEIDAPGILANDTAEGEADLAAALFSGPENGTLEIADDGSFIYTPDAGFIGQDSFMYVANDGASDSMLAAVTLRVGNTVPEAGNDAFSMAEDGVLTIDAAAGLLTNDSDLDGDALTAQIVSQPLHGTVELNADGSFTYTPEDNYNGLDGFSYEVTDGLETSAVASATITIDPVNDSPVSVNDEYTTCEDTPLEIVAPGVLANDTDVDEDALSSILVIPPLHGELSLGADGAILYTPDANFHGVDGFSYLANDGSADSEAAAVTINVMPVADAPVADADAYATSEDTPLVVAAAEGVLAGDTDGDGDALTAALVSGPANGTLTLNPDGSFAYTPNANWSGSDSFVYQASDGTLTSEPVTVALTVCPVNDAPTATADEYELDQGTALTIAAAEGVLTNDSDIEGDPLTAALVTGPAHGTLTLSGDGSFTYTPNADFSGEDSFVYKASDDAAATEATVALTVKPIVEAPTPDEENQRPLAVNDVFNVESGATLQVPAIGVLSNDSDPEALPITASLFSGPMHGSVSLAADGSFNYTPAADFVGMDAFLYRVSDGELWSPLAAVSIHVTPAAETPEEIPPPCEEPEEVPPPCAEQPEEVPPPVVEEPEEVPPPCAEEPEEVPPPVEEPEEVPVPCAEQPEEVPPPVEVPEEVPPPCAEVPEEVPPPCAEVPEEVPPPVEEPEEVPPPCAEQPEEVPPPCAEEPAEVPPPAEEPCGELEPAPAPEPEPEPESPEVCEIPDDLLEEIARGRNDNGKHRGWTKGPAMARAAREAVFASRGWRS